MKSAKLQICLLSLLAVCWISEGAYATKEDDGRLTKESEAPLILSPSISENVRVKRQDDTITTTTTTVKPKKPRPHNIFKLVSELATETKNETKKAFSDIVALFNSQFGNDTLSTTTTTTTTTPAPPPGTQDNATTPTTTTTTEADEGTTQPFRISREEFLGIIRNNLQGIVRLFRKEVKIALADSSKNVKEFGRDLGIAFRPLVYGKH